MTSTDNPFKNKWSIKPPTQEYKAVLKLLDDFAEALRDLIVTKYDSIGRLNLEGDLLHGDINVRKEEGLLTNSGQEFRIAFTCRLPELASPYRVVLCRAYVPSNAKAMKLDTYSGVPKTIESREELQIALEEFGTWLNDTGQIAQLQEIAKRATP